MTNKKPAFGLYIHWPYCLSKCPYCDFASCVIQKIDEEILLKSYIRDILFFKEAFSSFQEVTSIFFGGGTPSLMSEKMFDTLMNTFSKHFSISNHAEISLEANPDAITLNKMKSFKQSGLNRLSIGVQSLKEKDLKFLGRKHSLQTALATIQNAKNVFNRINIDLIYARPHQRLKDWENELLTALNLGLSHYSLYQLTLEENTPFYKNNIPQISQTQAVRLYKLTEDIMTAHNILPYEISNYAKKGQECRHNLIYWRGQNYLGIGPSAHGRFNLIATETEKNVTKWIKSNPTLTPLTQTEKKDEHLLMGLRLIQEGYLLEKLNPISVQKAIQKGWVFCDKKYLFTTQKGRLMLNQLILLLSN